VAGGGASCCRGAGAAPVKPPPLRPPVCDRYLAVTWPLTVDRWLRQPSPSPPQPSQVFKKSRSPATILARLQSAHFALASSSRLLLHSCPVLVPSLAMPSWESSVKVTSADAETSEDVAEPRHRYCRVARDICSLVD
jgi:hypothetical protein